ncbi:hypothetical protein GPK34_06830 [Secundilactobacillus kimchicus]|uniref:hypothetical protein n=1 Tax=Secundilactobacillus kimchicus TaxID=528209 RepID=UPI001C028A12|nr:hypothetical protein [Secundilactobacillus kimchicus]MBT9671743.1 hypothetical protein [Secundilactobacillus kimchicus]
MAKHYLKLNDQRFPISNQVELAKDEKEADFTVVTVATADEIDFNQNFQHYQITDTGTYVKGGESAVTAEEVNRQLAAALDTLAKQSKVIDKATDRIGQQQEMMGALTTQAMDSQTKVDQLSQMVAALTSAGMDEKTTESEAK